MSVCYVVTGTDTGIGKTVVAAGLAGNLRARCPNPSPICSEPGKSGFSWWKTNARPRPMR